jgi:hypothetical protein
MTSINPLVSLITVIAFTAVASAQNKYSTEVPKATAAAKITSSITLDARNTVAGRAKGPGTSPSRGAKRVTTAHTQTVEITVGNLGTTTETVTIKWFWAGRYETSNNWFRSEYDEKLVTVEPQKPQIILAESAGIEGHDIKKQTKKKHMHYKSGGDMQGWVVVAYDNKHEIQAIKTSDPLLNGFVASPPPKQRQ